MSVCCPNVSVPGSSPIHRSWAAPSSPHTPEREPDCSQMMRLACFRKMVRSGLSPSDGHCQQAVCVRADDLRAVRQLVSNWVGPHRLASAGTSTVYLQWWPWCSPRDELRICCGLDSFKRASSCCRLPFFWQVHPWHVPALQGIRESPLRQACWAVNLSHAFCCGCESDSGVPCVAMTTVVRFVQCSVRFYCGRPVSSELCGVYMIALGSMWMCEVKLCSSEQASAVSSSYKTITNGSKVRCNQLGRAAMAR